MRRRACMYSTITLSLILYHVQTCNSLLTKVTTHKGFNQKKRTCKLGHNGPIVSHCHRGRMVLLCPLPLGHNSPIVSHCHCGTMVLLCPIAIGAQWSYCVPLSLGHNGPTVFYSCCAPFPLGLGHNGPVVFHFYYESLSV